jgi:hypothetical protein
LRKKIVFKRKNEKKESIIKPGVERPKGNGINDGNVGKVMCLCRSLLVVLNQQKNIRPITLLSLLSIFLKTTKSMSLHLSNVICKK